MGLIRLLLATILCFQDNADDKIEWGKPFFGIKAESITPESRKSLGKSLQETFKLNSSRISVSIGTKGVIVLEVIQDFEGVTNNLKPFDVIQKIDGVEIQNKDDFREVLSKKTPGVAVEFSILRPTLNRNKVTSEKTQVSCTPISQYIHTMSKFKVQKDEFKNRTFYTADGFNRMPLCIYIGEREDGSMYQMVTFRSEGIIGLQSVEVLVDAEKFKIEPTLKEKLDNTIIGTPSFEWFDRQDTELNDMLKRIESAKKVAIRMKGRAEVKDFEIRDIVVANIKVNKELMSAMEWKRSQK